MTDRYHSLTVTLERNTRSDDAQNIMEAIQMIRGVLNVTPHVADMETHMAEARAKQEFANKLWDVLKG